MKYMGSKARIAKHILPIILKDRKEGQCYVEPFVGGANMIDKVDGNRIGGEFNKYIAEMWKELVNGVQPIIITKDDYKKIKKNHDNYPDWLVGWVGVACSYSGKWFGGFAGDYPESRRCKNGVLPNYQKESINSVKKQLPNLYDVEFVHSSYDELNIPPESIIYCDPPYANTTKYKDDFDHDKFWQWCRDKVKDGHKVFISEYNAPDDFICVWQQEVKSSLSANGKSGGSKNSIEKLLVHESQV